MKRLLLTGAGASAFLSGVSPCAPPLGSKLFDELQAECRAWRDLPRELWPQFNGPQGFEAGFGAVRATDDLLTTGLLREMGGFFLKYRSENNEYDELLAKLSRGGVLLSTATLNYDLLLDDALMRLAERHGKVSARPRVLRVHGAPTFWPRANIRNCTFSGASECNVDAPVEELSVELAMARAFADDSLAPAMALYSRDKETLFCKSFLDEVKAAYTSRVADADEILVVGIAYAPHDRHVWEPLDSTMAKVHIVNPDALSFLDFQVTRSRHGRRTTLHEKSLSQFMRS